MTWTEYLIDRGWEPGEPCWGLAMQLRREEIGATQAEAASTWGIAAGSLKNVEANNRRPPASYVDDEYYAAAHRLGEFFTWHRVTRPQGEQ